MQGKPEQLFWRRCQQCDVRSAARVIAVCCCHDWTSKSQQLLQAAQDTNHAQLIAAKAYQQPKTTSFSKHGWTASSTPLDPVSVARKARGHSSADVLAGISFVIPSHPNTCPWVETVLCRACRMRVSQISWCLAAWQFEPSTETSKICRSGASPADFVIVGSRLTVLSGRVFRLLFCRYTANVRET